MAFGAAGVEFPLLLAGQFLTTVRPHQPADRQTRRQAISAEAIRLFARKGFVDASIGDVAEEAEVAVTAVNYHSSGKE